MLQENEICVGQRIRYEGTVFIITEIGKYKIKDVEETVISGIRFDEAGKLYSAPIGKCDPYEEPND